MDKKVKYRFFGARCRRDDVDEVVEDDDDDDGDSTGPPGTYAWSPGRNVLLGRDGLLHVQRCGGRKKRAEMVDVLQGAMLQKLRLIGFTRMMLDLWSF